MTGSVAIDGPGTALLFLDGNHAGRVFHIEGNAAGAPIVVAIKGMTVEHGFAGAGGGI